VSNREFSDEDTYPNFLSHDQVPQPLINKTTEVIAFTSGTIGAEDIIARVPESKVREILDIRDLAVGKIYSHLMNAVRNGTPLKGRCDYCPSVHIK
jgi:hypothetical protein